MAKANKAVVFTYKGIGGKGSGRSRKSAVAFDKKAYKKEVSRLSSLANKRLVRIQNNKLTDSPAYQRWVADGEVKFGVAGKTFNELQQEMSRLNRFVNSETSTIRGISSTLKTMAKNTGIKYKNLTDLRKKAANFFTLASKVEQYLRVVEDMGSAIGYNEIWEVINTYVSSSKISLDGAETDIESLIATVGKIIINAESRQVLDYEMNDNWVFLD